MGRTWVTVAATPDGGVLGSSLGDVHIVSKLLSDGTATWTRGYFAGRDDLHLSAGPTGFLVGGTVDDGERLVLDPGPTVAHAPNQMADFFSRYAY